MGLSTLGTEETTRYRRNGKRTLSVSTACMLAFSSFCVSPSSAQTADQFVSMIRFLASGAGVVDACNADDQLRKKITLAAEKPNLAPVKEVLLEGYEKGFNEKVMWDNGRWDQISCEKLRANGVLEITTQKANLILDKMLAK